MELGDLDRWDGEGDGAYLARIVGDALRSRLAGELPDGFSPDDLETWAVSDEPERVLLAVSVPPARTLRVSGMPMRADIWVVPGEPLVPEDLASCVDGLLAEARELLSGAAVLRSRS